MPPQTSFPVNQYLIAISTPTPPPEFLAFVEKFAPYFPIFGQVYVLSHHQDFTPEQLTELVSPTLPPNVSFYVAVLHDGIHTPARSVQS